MARLCLKRAERLSRVAPLPALKRVRGKDGVLAGADHDQSVLHARCHVPCQNVHAGRLAS